MDENTTHQPSQETGAPAGASREELDDALRWLEELAARQGKSIDELADSHRFSPDESPFRGLIDDSDSDLPDWLREVPETALEEPGDEFESRLDWLAKMASRESIEELPTLEWRRFSEGVDDFSDLEQDSELGAALPVEERRTDPGALVAAAAAALAGTEAQEPASDSEAQPAVPQPAEADAGETPVAETSPLASSQEFSADDLDAAMAWIEELAASQDAPIEDLPSVADRALASKLLAEASAAELTQAQRQHDQGTPAAAPVHAFPVTGGVQLSGDPDTHATEPTEELSFEDALAYLEQLAGKQATLGVDDVTAAVAEDEIPGEGWIFVSLAAEPEEAVEDQAVEDGWIFVALADEDVASFLPPELPEELTPLEQALFDLDELAGKSGSGAEASLHDQADSSARLVALASTLDRLELTIVEEEEAAASDEALLLAMPDDPDAALEWLESMAGEASGSSTDAYAPEVEPVSEPSTPTLPETAALIVAVEEIDSRLDLSDMPDDPDEAMAWLEAMAAREAATRAPEPEPVVESAEPEEEAPELVTPPRQQDAWIDLLKPLPR